VIYGVDPVVSGTITYLGQKLHRHDPRRAVRKGIAYVPEDRRGQGLALVRSVKENVTLPHLRILSTARVLQLRREKSAVNKAIKAVGVSPPRIDLDVGGYSGGNQQKVLFARWLIGQPRLVILDEPARGVDVGAKYAIYETIVELAEAGMAVLLISSEHEEVMNLAHRVLLVRGGTVIDEVDPLHFTVDDVLYRLFDVGAEE
jgi:simple sugar transport system ATP-binding protein/ribose transport system ATP-binding protein